MGAKWADVMGAFPPGKLIREELEARGWTQQELAKQIGRPVQTISMIINGRKAITAETALQLQEAFGASASMWMGLEADWQLYKESEKQKTAERLKKGIRSLPARVASKARSASRATLGKSFDVSDNVLDFVGAGVTKACASKKAAPRALTSQARSL